MARLSISDFRLRISDWLPKVAVALVLFTCASNGLAAEPALKILFLGDNGHHTPLRRCNELREALSQHNIDITYTDQMTDINAANLAKYDGLMIYANTIKIEEDQEKAMLDFISGGKGIIPIHCASACFHNSPKYIELVGAQFKAHKTGTFSATIVMPDHPIMKGFKSFTAWDETYVHDKHNADRTILQVRKEGATEEPWTWVRNLGKGRMFYTASGHDERVWTNPGFQSLIERGTRWACGDDKCDEHSKPFAEVEEAKTTPKRTDVKPFEYVDADVPFYNPGGNKKDKWGKMQKPVEPAESQKHLVLPEGFEAQLFVSEPEVIKPIAMNWDHKGRLWVIETIDYPNDKHPTGEGHDRIKICEDTDGDGRADKFTIFADKLSIPTSLTFANGGVIVQSAPETLFLKDTNGDDKADEIKPLFSGWGVGDTHAGPSNLHWGFDNWIWGIVGYSSFGGTVGGEQVKFGAGFYRFKPDGSKLEFLRSNNNNSWGLGFSEEAIVFGSTANGNASVYLPIPNRYYESVRGWSSSVLSSIADSQEMHPVTDRVRQVDWHGKFTAGAGHALYTARTYPKDYWNSIAFVNEPTGHVTATFKLERRGSDFVARNRTLNLLASDDEWTAPIMSEVGPDGNVWVIDWYNYIVQHNPTPQGFKNGRGNAYETPLRDKEHGRIYRIVNKAAPATKFTPLNPDDTEGLVAALKNDNMFWRMHAQRLLVERAKTDAIPSLIKLVGDQGVDAIGLNPAAIHALYALQGLGALDGKNEAATGAAIAALKHPSAGVRRNAAVVLPRIEAGASALISSGVLSDADAQVRLASFLALSEMPRSAAAADALIAALNDPKNAGDRWIPDAITVAAAANDFEFLKSIAAQKDFDKRSNDVVGRVAGSYARGTPESISALTAALANANPASAEAIIAGLANGWPKTAKAKLDDSAEKALITLMTNCSAGAKAQLSSLATRWGTTALEKFSADIAAGLLSKAGDEKAADAQRIDAAAQLIALRKANPETATSLFKLITPRSSPEFSRGVLDALRQSEATEVGQTLVDGLKLLSPAARSAALSVLLERAEWTEAFIKGVEDGKAQLSDLTLDQKQSLAAHPKKEIAAAAKKLLASGGGLPDADRQKVIDALSPKVLGKGDAAKGKLVFAENCMKCHMHSGQGAKIGPDLTGMAAHPKSELIIHIMDPSRSVEGNYRQYTVSTTEGQVFVGLLASESKNAIELLDAEAKTHPIQRDNIKKMVASPKSLMPEGFEQLGEEKITNLLEFLTSHGQFLPLDLRKAATVVTTKGMFFEKESDIERMVFPDWSPKTFNGVTFNLVDPQGDKVPNAVLLYGPNGKIPPQMPKSVSLACSVPAKAIHLLSGVSGWGATGPKTDGSVSMIVRLKYADGKVEEHPLKDGVHFADYIRVIDVPESKLAFKLRGQQIRYLSITPKRQEKIDEIELVKGPDHTAPIVMAVTVECLE